jgi:2-dehydropantoate 2-reductase
VRTLVVGAGAIGGYFGGRLLQAGCDITFLLRPRRIAQIERDGLVIKSPTGDAVLRPVSYVQADSIKEPFEVVIVSCKAYDLLATMESFAPAVGPRTVILPLLNGLRHIDDLAHRFDRQNVMGGLCMISAVLDDAGAILHLNELHRIVFGELDGSQTERLAALAELLRRGSFESRASSTIVHELWEKWVFIASCGGINTLMRASIGDLVAAGAADRALALYDECSKVARAHGYPPREAAASLSRQLLTSPGSTLTASLLKDIERGARTEGDHILGELHRRASLVPEGTPLLRLAHAAVASYEIRRERESRPSA